MTIRGYGIRREGAYYGVQSFIYKLSNGVALALVSLLLQLFRYKETPFLDEGTGEVVYSFMTANQGRNLLNQSEVRKVE